MSGFKRMQSKVFWGQMAAQDMDNIPLLIRNRSETPPSSRNLDNSYCNFGRDSDTDNLSDTSSQENQSKIENITAINTRDIVDNKNEKTIDDNCFENNHKDEEEEEEAGVEILNEENNDNEVEIIHRIGENFRCSSPVSDQGHGSLDSGFSDSERAKSPGINVDGTPKRMRKRTKRLRDRPRVNPRLNALWKENEMPPNPAHTSTPNRESSSSFFSSSSAARSRQSVLFNNEIIVALENDLKQSTRNNVEKSSFGVPESISREEEDCLNDYLYEKDPPVYESPTSSSGSSGSTPSFSGHWYSRLSNEHSKSSSSSTTASEMSRRAYHENRSQGSVKAWLKDIVEDYEAECCVTLQSKALPRNNNTIYDITEESQTRDIRMLTTAATAAANELLIRADKFSKHIQDVIKKISHLESGRYEEAELLRSIEGEAFSILSELGAPPARRINAATSLRSILRQLEALKNTVNSALDIRLDFYIERVVRGLEEAPRGSGSAARGALAALTALGLAGSRASTSIARCSGVRALLTSLISVGHLSSELRASTLRALASVCCCSLAINHFVNEGGPEIIVDLLASKTTPEKEKMEAAALVVQLTAPWTDALGLRHLAIYANTLVSTLTELSYKTNCSQTLLLSVAALNNLGDSPKCVYEIVQCDSISKLLRCIRKTSGINIWLMEQVASLVGKLAKYPEVTKYLEKTRASVALVCFLRLTPPGLENAYERLSITAAAALTRLCVNPEIAQQVVAVGGADCLPDLNKIDSDDDDDKIGLLRYTNSLRIACKKAAKHIDAAKACDYSI